MSFSVPNGAYRVTLHMGGQADVQLEDGRLSACATPVTIDRPLLTDAVEVGVVRISDERLHARIEASSWVVLRLIGLTPLHRALASADEVERTERLRTLGYVE